jgi:hypothetical protein
MVRLTVRIDEFQDSRVRAEAKHRGVSRARVVRELIDQYLSQPQEESPRWKKLLEQIDVEPLPPGTSIDDFLYGSRAT